MAELVDALASGASVRKYVKVQVLSSAPEYRIKSPREGDFCYTSHMSTPQTPEACPFCLPNDVLRGDILYEDDWWYFVSAEDGELKHGGMIITKRHIATPFDISAEEWMQLHAILPICKSFVDTATPDGYNMGWNIHPVGGQNVAHAHLHLFGRFADEPLAHKGIRYAFKQLENQRGSAPA